MSLSPLRLLRRKQLPHNRRRAPILLVHPPWFRLQGSNLIPYPSGPCFVAGNLEQAGLDALVWNGDFDRRETLSMGGTNPLNTAELVNAHARLVEALANDRDPCWLELRSILELVRPRVVGISSYSASYDSARRVAELVKAHDPSIVTVLGGMHATIARGDILRSTPAFDVLVVGESERSVPPLFSRLLAGQTGKALCDIQGLILRIDGEIVSTGAPVRVENLDEVPWPARHRMIDLDKMPPVAHQPVFGYRGCPYRCVFCGSHNIFGRRPRLRSAANMVDELAHVHEKYGTKYFYICDDLFLYDEDRVRTFCALVRARKLPIYYTIQTRAEMVDEELLPLLKASGCQHLAVGVEVGDEEIRRKIQKGNTNDQVRRAAQLTRKHGLRMSGFFMFGFPWETRETMEKTLAFMKELDPCVAFPYIVTPAQGTELLNIAREMNLIPAALDMSSFAHTSPKMGLTQNLSEEEKQQLIDKILAAFTRHNRKSFLRDIFRRPLFYLYAAHDAGLLGSRQAVLRKVKELIEL